MWEWSRTVAEHAAAASWTSWQRVEPEPTILDPDFRTEAERDSVTPGESKNADDMACPPTTGYVLVG